MTAVDVLIVGAGPAGATAALNLAPTRRVLVVERRAEDRSGIGESLPPAARRLLADMGLLDSFDLENHAVYFGNRSIWGSPQPSETDFLRSLDGHGWHLDRGRFDAWLRGIAVERGAWLLRPARIESIEREGTAWLASIAASTGRVVVAADLLIDAGGRVAPVGRRLGARRHSRDRLVCGWAHGDSKTTGRGAGLTYIEATEEGWWYTAPLPGRRRVVAFHTDADLAAAVATRDRAALIERVESARELSGLLAECGFVASGSHGFTAAHSAALMPCAGHSWLAAGDAALAFDPLSSQGLFNALYTGLAAAETADRCLAGAVGALDDYVEMIADVRERYQRDLATWYHAETRWSHAPFWQRRQPRSIAAHG